MATSERIQRIDAEIERIHGLIGDLDKDWSRLRWSGLLVPLVGPVFMMTDALTAMVYFFTTGGFFATAAYLIYVRRREYQGEIRQLQGDKKRLGA